MICPQWTKVENVLSQSPSKWNKTRLGMKEMEILPLKKKIPTGNNMSKNLPDLKIQETFQKAKEFRTTQISAVTEAIKLGFESLIPLVV